MTVCLSNPKLLSWWYTAVLQHHSEESSLLSGHREFKNEKHIFPPFYLITLTKSSFIADFYGAWQFKSVFNEWSLHHLQTGSFIVSKRATLAFTTLRNHKTQAFIFGRWEEGEGITKLEWIITWVWSLALSLPPSLSFPLSLRCISSHLWWRSHHRAVHFYALGNCTRTAKSNPTMKLILVSTNEIYYYYLFIYFLNSLPDDNPAWSPGA